MAWVCVACGARSEAYAPKCPQCAKTYVLEQEATARAQTEQSASRVTLLRPSTEPLVRCKTGLAQLDEALGGGLVLASSTIIAGEPGAGKSTMALLLAEAVLAHGVLYVVSEGTERQWNSLAGRTGRGQAVPVLFTQSVDELILECEQEDAKILIVDQLHALQPRRDVLATALRLVKFTEDTGRTLILVAELSYAGNVRDSASLAYAVDCVLRLELPTMTAEAAPDGGAPAPSPTALQGRTLVCTKNRNGPAPAAWPLTLGTGGWVATASSSPPAGPRLRALRPPEEA